MTDFVRDSGGGIAQDSMFASDDAGDDQRAQQFWRGFEEGYMEHPWNGWQSSLHPPGVPTQNNAIERFMRTLKGAHAARPYTAWTVL